MKRRTFLVGASAVAAAVAAPWVVASIDRRRIDDVRILPVQPRRAAVIFFSQTGHTRRVGRLIARHWERQGLEAVASDYRAFDLGTLRTFDLLVLGSPVNYYEAPGHFRTWIKSLPPLGGIPVAAFATFGGKGGNQFNAAAGLLQRMVDRGAVPVGIELFGNMSSFAPTWSLGNEERILAYSHLPDANTWTAVRKFADDLLGRVGSGTGIAVSGGWSPHELIKGSISIEGTKFLIGAHGVDAAACVRCGSCFDVCPVGAIDPATLTVDTAACVACLGCVNNCPTGAMRMNFLGKPVYGFKEFLKRHSIVIAEPPELV